MVEPEVPRRPSFQPTSLRLAAIVPIIAVGTLGFFLAVEIIFGGAAPSPPKAPLSAFGPTRTLEATYASIDPINAPPKDIQRSIFLPAACVGTKVLPTGGDATRPSLANEFHCGSSTGFLQAFYLAQLRHSEWKLFSQGMTTHDGGGTAYLAQKAGSDSFYWQLGIVIGRTTYTSTGGGVPDQSTKVTIRLFQSSTN
ncbi:MAG: hypothetical protein WCL38_00885 [Actinomycetota bacterium]